MPEGDTVWLAARRMDQALAGRALTRSEFRVPQLATVDLTGRQVLEVGARGKHLLIRIEGELTLHTHFMLAGIWRIFRAGARLSGGPAHEIRVILANHDHAAVGYRLPVVELLATGSESEAVGHLGPDLLGADWDQAQALRRLASAPDREIGEALLDQRNLAGIGNLYKTEVLFLSGITPWTLVADVADLPAMLSRVRRLMMANRDHGPQTTTGNLRRGQDHWVFERADSACRRCGHRIRRARQGEPPQDRLCYWCPACQAGPTPTSTGSSAAASRPA
ncbi:MAG TPA: DNA-formamidopyrimidine glycosylase family protein [Mycobacteriales bacterium]|jgi:endonuclease-8|nr:DNA-formamidopyrimidine glycosylase family protein [Mycobacteriales bacterium]